MAIFFGIRCIKTLKSKNIFLQLVDFANYVRFIFLIVYQKFQLIRFFKPNCYIEINNGSKK